MSSRKVEVPVPAWWPPKVGDKLRWVDYEHMPRLAHVVSVFEHDDCTRFVVAWYGIHRQWWHYEVVGPSECQWKFWPNGEDHPDPEWRARIAAAVARRSGAS